MTISSLRDKPMQVSLIALIATMAVIVVFGYIVGPKPALQPLDDYVPQSTVAALEISRVQLFKEVSATLGTEHLIREWQTILQRFWLMTELLLQKEIDDMLFYIASSHDEYESGLLLRFSTTPARKLISSWHETAFPALQWYQDEDWELSMADKRTAHLGLASNVATKLHSSSMQFDDTHDFHLYIQDFTLVNNLQHRFLSNSDNTRAIGFDIASLPTVMHAAWDDTRFDLFFDTDVLHDAHETNLNISKTVVPDDMQMLLLTNSNVNGSDFLSSSELSIGQVLNQALDSIAHDFNADVSILRNIFSSPVIFYTTDNGWLLGSVNHKELSDLAHYLTSWLQPDIRTSVLNDTTVIHEYIRSDVEPTREVFVGNAVLSWVHDSGIELYMSDGVHYSILTNKRHLIEDQLRANSYAKLLPDLLKDQCFSDLPAGLLSSAVILPAIKAPDDGSKTQSVYLLKYSAENSEKLSFCSLNTSY